MFAKLNCPNLLFKNKVIRNIDDIMLSAQKRKQVLQNEEYHINNVFSCENTVILEINWIGTLNLALGSIPVGSQLKSNFALFLEFANDRIRSQRN